MNCSIDESMVGLRCIIDTGDSLYDGTIQYDKTIPDSIIFIENKSSLIFINWRAVKTLQIYKKVSL